VWKDAIPSGAEAFDILADEIIAFSPIKNEQTKELKPAIDDTLVNVEVEQDLSKGLRRDN